MVFLKAVEAYLDHTADEGQILFLEQYFDLFAELDEILESQNIIQTENICNLMHSRIHQDITRWEYLEKKSKVVTSASLKYLYMAAAAIFLTFMSVYLYRSNLGEPKSDIDNSHSVAEIVPGGNRATLILANGSKISLTDTKNGEVMTQYGTILTKKGDSQLVYRNSGSPIENKYAYNAIETPNGGQFQLVLPDGTKVWLNAASSLRYPLAFQGNERKVELTGEAYFEVAKDKTRPFKVHSKSQIVEVLGTHFNINVYSNDPSVKTTLLEGSVRVTNTSLGVNTVIRPGQQAVIHKNSHSQSGIEVNNTDIDEAVAWKNGYFMFNSEELESVLRKISRWYDIDIQYQNDELKHQLFSGTLSKYMSASQVLKKLELLQSVHFKTEGRKIIVTPYLHKI
ncbi:hypothetical protein TH53_12615 [Pedobacter lusitanus]|uniref:FecR protein n=1 Tax=Pedobacter lusitanus TaxID=1503925 RepID=A0A0D0FWM7_9SPHI|nr:hypothetical protein TH53_12615 [Pedobacter lusitanus]